jgi:3-deoxy-7-phosphoheptulonate synthase
MIVVMSMTANAQQISDVIARIRAMGYDIHLSEGKERTIIGVIGRGRPLDRDQLGLMDGVQSVMPVTHPYKIASREYHPDDTLIPLNGIEVGGPQLAVIAGPCAVEDREQIIETAYAVREAGATALRGGAFKPRTSPYSFQGKGCAIWPRRARRPACRS